MLFIWHNMENINICVNLFSECFTHTKMVSIRYTIMMVINAKGVSKNAAIILAEVSVRRFNQNYHLFANL